MLCLGACQGVGNEPRGQLLPAAATASVSDAKSRSGTVVFTVTRLVGAPAPGGPYALSSATNSIAGTIGSSVVKAIPIGPTSRRCVQASGILTCTVSVRAKAGTHDFNFYAYGTADGSGAKLARAIGEVTVYARRKNHAGALNWNGFAKGIAVVAAPTSLVQGGASTAQIAVYGVDPAGGMLALPYVRGPNGKYISGVRVSETGPYVAFQTPAPSSESPGLFYPVSFQYDGVLTGTEKVRATPINPDIKPATTKLKLLPGPTTSASLFVQVGDGFGSFAGNVFQFVPAGSPNVAPLRTLKLRAVLAGSATNGGFWGLQPSVYGYSELDEYDRYGNRILRIPAAYPGASPGNTPFIGAATLDRSGNAYVVDQLAGYLPKIDVYAAGCYTCAPQSSTAVGTTTVRSGAIGVQPYIAVDGSGNAYVAENYSGNNGTIFEYAPGATSPVRTISVLYLNALAADSTGNLYAIQAPAGDSWELFEYPPSGSPKVLLSNSSTTLVTGVATGPDDTLYAGTDYRSVASDPYQFEVQTLAPGSSTWKLLLGGTATGLPRDAISASIVVP